MIGVGGYGSVHLRDLRRLEADGCLRLVAVADPFLDKPGLAAVRAELVAAGVTCYPDYRALFSNHPALDLVVIVAPIPAHEEMVVAALKSGARIYLEKPPVPTIQQWTRLVELDRDGRIAVGFQMLAMQHLRTLRGWMKAGHLGRIRAISFGGLWPRSSTYFQRSEWAGKLQLNGEPVFDGPATNALSHIINNVMFLAGAETGENCATPVKVGGEFYRAREDIESYDLACLHGEFASGLVFAGVLGHCAVEKFPYEIRVHGEIGNAWLDEDGVRLESDLDLPAGYDPLVRDRAASDHYDETCLWASGLREHPVCSLRDTEGYIRTVNTAMVSSGGIHPVPADAVERCGEEHDYVAVVPNLPFAVQQVLANACPLGACGIKWTRPGNRIETASVRSLDLSTFGCEQPQSA
ncbi:MAG: Gfo/Idh/MocA family protein [Rariglobus sp.]